MNMGIDQVRKSKKNPTKEEKAACATGKEEYRSILKEKWSSEYPD